jgi:hypothetical protein
MAIQLGWDDLTIHQILVDCIFEIDFCSLARWNLNISGNTEDQYFHVCPPGPVDHSCGIPSCVSFSCKPRIVEKRRSSDPQASKSLGTGPGSTIVCLPLPLESSGPGGGGCDGQKLHCSSTSPLITLTLPNRPG